MSLALLLYPTTCQSNSILTLLKSLISVSARVIVAKGLDLSFRSFSPNISLENVGLSIGAASASAISPK